MVSFLQRGEIRFLRRAPFIALQRSESQRKRNATAITSAELRFWWVELSCQWTIAPNWREQNKWRFTSTRLILNNQTRKPLTKYRIPAQLLHILGFIVAKDAVMR